MKTFLFSRDTIEIAWIWIIVLLMLNNSCSSDENFSIEVLPDKIHKSDFSLDNLAEDLIIIPLTFSEPGFIMRIEWKEPYFYISTSDGQKVNKVRIINRSGMEINCLDKCGRGPGEYISVYEVALDRNNSIYINTDRKIVVYDRRLNHLRDIDWPEDLTRSEMRMYNENLYLFDKTIGNTVYDWISMDTLGQIMSTKLYQCYNSRPVPRRYPLFIFEQNDRLHRYRAIDDTVFSLDSTGWDTAYLISRKFQDGYRAYTQEELSRPVRSDVLAKELYPEHLRNISGIWGLGNNLLITYDTHHNKRLKSESVLIRHSENKIRAELISRRDFIRGEAYYTGLPNDWIGFGALQPINIVEFDSVPHIVSFMDAFEFKNMVQSDEFINAIPKRPELKLKYQNLADTLDSDSDPVLLLLKLK